MPSETPTHAFAMRHTPREDLHGCWRIKEALVHLEASEVLRSAMGSELLDAFVAVRRAEVDAFADACDRELATRTRWRY